MLSANPSLLIVLTTAIVLMLGALSQWLGHRFTVPPILFLLGSGLLLGNQGLGLIQPELYGTGLRAIVSISVAIIVFEGALLIDLKELRHCSRSVLGLVTVGTVTTFLLAGFSAHLLLGLPLKLGLLYGAIVSMTAPTVVIPILKRLHLNRRLETILKAESVLIDAVGVLLTAAVFSYISASNHGVAGGLLQLLVNLTIGGAIGIGTILGLKAAFTRAPGLPGDQVRILVLGAVLLGYSLSEALAHESGIAAIVSAGLMAGLIKLPYKETILQFKGDLSSIALSLVFVLLAADIQLDQVFSLGWQGLLVVVLLMVAIRPLAVLLSTWGATLSWGERFFIAWMGPRGIVAVSMATLMAMELKAWNIQGSEPIAPLVLLTVILTVLVEGGGAAWVARRLNVMPKKILIIGCDEISRRLGSQLVAEGEAVTLIDQDPEPVRLALSGGLDALLGDVLEHETRLGLAWCQALVAATPSDKANLMICQTLRARFPKLRLIARVNDPKYEEAFQAGNIETITLAEAAATSLSTLVLRPMTFPLLGFRSAGNQIVETPVESARCTEIPLSRLDLPKDCIIALLKREGALDIPNGSTTLRVGDIVTLIGKHEAVEQFRTRLGGDS
ncbi:MAG TPA: hypothetical protein DD435_01040 [Cyanobacteria bacterium UBA8530]|nr:hypothetical protein [Cyanobacteria bacterium UBA8530]